MKDDSLLLPPSGKKTDITTRGSCQPQSEGQTLQSGPQACLGLSGGFRGPGVGALASYRGASETSGGAVDPGCRFGDPCRRFRLVLSAVCGSGWVGMSLHWSYLCV